MHAARDRLFALLCCLGGAPGLTLRALQQHVPDDLEVTRDDRVIPWLDALLGLEADGLVDVTSGGIVLRVDPEVGLTDKQVAADALSIALDVLISLLPERSWLPSCWPPYDAYSEVALRLIARCDEWGMSEPQQAELALRCAAYFHSRCRYLEAERVARTALQLTAAALLADTDDLRAAERVVRAHGHLGRILDALGAFDQAMASHEEAVALARQVYVGRPFLIAGPLLYQARTLRDLGRFEDAVAAVEEAALLLAAPYGVGAEEAGVDAVTDHRAVEEVFGLRITQGRLLLDVGRVRQGIELLRGLQLGEREEPRRWVGDASLPFDQARILVAQGQMERDLGLYAEAEANLREALRLNQVHFGPHHLVVARTIDQLARVHRDQGRYEHAGNEYRRSLTVKSAHLTEDHPDCARTRVALGGILRRLGDLAAAVEAADAGLLALEGRFDRHPEIVHALTTRAAVARDAGDPGTARQLLARAEDVIGSLPQPVPTMGHLSHPLAAVTYLTTASLDRGDGRLSAALRHAQWAVEIDEELYGPDHAETARPLAERGRVHRRLGELHRADEDLLAAERILVWNFQGLHPEIARIKGHRARVLRSLDQPLAAERSLRELERARLMTRSLLGAGHVDVSALTAEFGRGLLARGRHDEALALLSESLAAQEAVGGRAAERSLEVAITHASLGDLYAALGSEDECRRAKDRSLAIKRAIYGPRHNQVARTLRDYAGALRRLHPSPSPGEATEVLALLTGALDMALEVDVDGIEGVLPTAVSLGHTLVGYGGDPTLATSPPESMRASVVEALEEGLARVTAAFTGDLALSPGNPRVASAAAMLDRLRASWG